MADAATTGAGATPTSEPRPLRLAHRGDWRTAPENSLAAMLAALRVAGCDGLEFDLRSSLDGVPVLLHDEDLARVQNVPVKCATLTAEELAGHGIPTFQQVLDAVDCDVFLDVEFKERVDAAIDVLELERGRVADDGTPELRSAVVSSFGADVLGWLREIRPKWPRWLNAYDLRRDDGAGAGAWLRSDLRRVPRHRRGRGASRARRRARCCRLDGPASGDYDRLAGLGLRAICAEASALEP